MKTFSLPSSFAAFDWDASNGTATRGQTALAYHTLMYKSLCADFSRLVWNDIVTMTYNLQQQMGLTWDDTYRTYSGTKLWSVYEPFFAKIFNSLILNINSVAPTTWKWQFDKNFDGYIGRDYVQGVTEAPDNPDTVYASYLLEIVRKLNLLIDICKGDADYAALAAPTKAITDHSAELSGLQTATMAYTGAHIIVPDASVQSARGKPIALVGRMRSSSVSSVELMTPPQSLVSNIKSLSTVSAEMEFYRFYSRMAYVSATESIVNAELLIRQARYAESASISFADIKSALLELADILSLRAGIISLTDVDATITTCQPKPLISSTTAAMTFSDLVCEIVPPKRMTSYIASYAYSRPPSIGLVLPKYITPQNNDMLADYNGDVVIRRLTDMHQASVSAYAVSNSVMGRMRPVMAAAEISATSKTASALTSGKLYDLKDVSATSLAYSAAEFSTKSPRKLAANIESYTNAYGSLTNADIVDLNAFVKACAEYASKLDRELDNWFDPIQTDSDLYIRSVYLQFMADNLHIDSPMRTGMQSDMQAVADYSAATTELISIQATVQAFADCTAEIENGSTWYDPEQDGTNLYIPQSYQVTIDNTDMEVK